MHNDFATNLIYLRGEKNLTQQELGDAAGVSPSQISRYEAGMAKPRKTVLRKLADALGVSVDHLTRSEPGSSELPDRQTISANFPELLVWARAEQGMTQRELADASGVSLVQVARYETGRSKPRLGAVIKLSSALNVDPKIFMEGGAPDLKKLVLEFPEGGGASVMIPNSLLDTIEKTSAELGISFVEGFNNLLTNTMNQMAEQIKEAKTDEERKRIIDEFRRPKQ